MDAVHQNIQVKSHGKQYRLMNSKLKIIFSIQAVLAFIIVFAINYFALGMSPFLSFSGALGFTLFLVAWAGYRYNRHLKKQKEKREREGKL